MYVCMYVYAYVERNVGRLQHFTFFSEFWQKIRTVELDGKTIKLQIVSQNIHFYLVLREIRFVIYSEGYVQEPSLIFFV